MTCSLALSAAGQTKCFSLIKSPIIPENTEPCEKVKFWQSVKNVFIYPATSLLLINTWLCLTDKTFRKLANVRLSYYAECDGNECLCPTFLR